MVLYGVAWAGVADLPTDMCPVHVAMMPECTACGSISASSASDCTPYGCAYLLHHRVAATLGHPTACTAWDCMAILSAMPWLVTAILPRAPRHHGPCFSAAPARGIRSHSMATRRGSPSTARLPVLPEAQHDLPGQRNRRQHRRGGRSSSRATQGGRGMQGGCGERSQINGTLSDQ